MRTNFVLTLSFLFSFSLLFHNCTSDKATPSVTTTEKVNISPSKSTFARQIVTPPLQSVDVPFKTFKIKSSKAQTLNLDNGTTINIPANAFVDAVGNPISSEVEVQYREFHNAAEILASGIPMKAFYNGEEGLMQTAGMFEINATTSDPDGVTSQAFLAEDKKINVNMASNIPDDNFDSWAFNAEDGNWENMGSSTAQPNPQRVEAEKALANLPKMQAPTPPIKFDKSKPILNFDINVEHYPELKKIKNIFWQYTGKGENPQNAKWIYAEKWDSADVKKGSSPNEYTLVLKSKNRNFSTSVCASQTGEEFENALADYEDKMKSYKSSFLSKEEKRAFMDRQAKFVRDFNIDRLGIYNCDILLRNPDFLLFAADFDFGKDVPKAHQKVNVYLITNDGRSVLAIPFQNRKQFGLDPKLDNQLVAILPNNKIATFSQRQFDEEIEAIEESSGTAYTFKMKVKDAPVKNMADLEKAIASL